MHKQITTALELQDLPGRTIMRSEHGTALQLDAESQRVFAVVGAHVYSLDSAIRFFAPMTVLDTPKEKTHAHTR